MIKATKQKISTLRSHEGFMRYFANTSWLFGEKILRMIVGLFVGIWVARYLGPEQFGLLSYAQSFVGLFTAIATLGLDGIVVRELVKDPSRRDELIGTAFWLKLIRDVRFFVILEILHAKAIIDKSLKPILKELFKTHTVVNSFLDSMGIPQGWIA